MLDKRVRECPWSVWSLHQVHWLLSLSICWFSIEIIPFFSILSLWILTRALPVIEWHACSRSHKPRPCHWFNHLINQSDIRLCFGSGWLCVCWLTDQMSLVVCLLACFTTGHDHSLIILISHRIGQGWMVGWKKPVRARERERELFVFVRACSRRRCCLSMSMNVTRTTDCQG